ncbi:MAG: hypothetical protein QOI35_2536 [Cryptosporangiaceae bacterium]|nr:hypothetical protein [Cryptosporangiaceae bacterium]
MTSLTATPSSPSGDATNGRAGARVRDWRGAAGLAAAVVAIVAVFAMPARHAAPRPVLAAAISAPALSSRWPAARPFAIPSVLPGGSPFRPKLVLNPSATVGVATSPDKRRVSLVIASGSGSARTLRTGTAGLVSFAAITAYGDQLFWLDNDIGTSGQQHTSLWSARVAGAGPPQRLAADVATPNVDGTRYSLQLDGGRLYWADSQQLDATVTRLRSIPVEGGQVTTRTVPGRWQLSAWPWLATLPSPGKPAALLNLVTGARTEVRARAGEALLCGPSWCRVTAGDVRQPQDTTLMRPDGTHSQRIATGGTTAITDEVALQGHFEPLGGAVNPNGITTATPLTLYDLRTASTVLIDPAATDARASGDYLWWSSGDNETLSWHGLDLRALG